MDCFNVRINCPRCRLNFDEDTHHPRVMYVCGHSICHHCLKLILKTAYLENSQHINCPVCDANHQIGYIFIDALNAFPRNFFGLDLVRFLSNSVTCKHTEEKKKFICFGNNCCQRSAFCLICYLEVHYDCDKNLILKVKNVKNHLRIIRNSSFTENTRKLLAKIREWPVTSNQKFLQATVDFMSNKLDWIEHIMAKFPEETKLSGHLWNCEFSELEQKIICQPNETVFFGYIQELNDILKNGELLSTLQFIFAFFTASFRANSVFEKLPSNIFKKLHLNLSGLESVQMKKNYLSETKRDKQYQEFKALHTPLLNQLAFRDFAQESVFFEKSLKDSIEESRKQLHETKEKYEVLELLLKDSISQIEQAVKESFTELPEKAIFKYSDFHPLSSAAKNVVPVLVSNDLVRNIVESSILKAEFYLSEIEYERLQSELKPVPEELRDIILSVIQNIESEYVYNSQKKQEALNNIGVFACQRDPGVFLNSFYKYKISFDHLNEIRRYLKDFDDELKFKVIARLMINFMIPVTKEQQQLLQTIAESTSADRLLIRAIRESAVHTLTPEKRNVLAEKIETVFKANEKAFVKFYEVYEQKNEILRKIDILNDKLVFELLALEFFGIFKP